MDDFRGALWRGGTGAHYSGLSLVSVARSEPGEGNAQAAEFSSRIGTHAATTLRSWTADAMDACIRNPNRGCRRWEDGIRRPGQRSRACSPHRVPERAEMIAHPSISRDRQGDRHAQSAALAVARHRRIHPAAVPGSPQTALESLSPAPRAAGDPRPWRRPAGSGAAPTPAQTHKRVTLGNNM